VVSRFVVLRGFAMMPRRMFVMFGCLAMMSAACLDICPS
jgi:hypothetical protein